jgi:hypothetical protein
MARVCEKYGCEGGEEGALNYQMIRWWPQVLLAVGLCLIIFGRGASDRRVMALGAGLAILGAFALQDRQRNQ